MNFARENLAEGSYICDKCVFFIARKGFQQKLTTVLMNEEKKFEQTNQKRFSCLRKQKSRVCKKGLCAFVEIVSSRKLKKLLQILCFCCCKKEKSFSAIGAKK